MKQKHLIIIGGATAAGKSQVAVDLAQHFKCEIISADSRQVYTELNIGVNKPSSEQLKAVPHHLIGHVSIREDYNAGLYERDAILTLNQLYQQHQMAILVGGTGLYLQAVMQGLDTFPETDPAVFNQLKQIHLEAGINALQDELLEKDPKYYEQVDRQNPHRLMRALAVIRSSGLKYSDLLTQKSKERSFRSHPILLHEERDLLYEKINLRVDEMIRQGLEQEALDLYPLRYLNSLQTVGYREWFSHFEGQLTKEEAIEKIKQHTRNYAKRQTTWFRPLHWPQYHAGETSQLIQYLKTAIG